MLDENASVEDIARTIAALREAPRDTGIWPTVKRYDEELSDALDALVLSLTPAKRRPPVPEPAEAGYPAEKRVADLNVEYRRREALHHAREAWGGTMSDDADRHARHITTLAAAFDRFLADGAVHQVPDEPQEGEADPAGEPAVTYQPLADVVRGIKHAPKILAAAIEWVDKSHMRNLGGPENWRNWADDHDVALIDAVLAYRGLPPLERKQP